MKYNFFTVKYLLSCSMSVVLTVKVEGLIEPPLAQMASTKACYKLGLIKNPQGPANGTHKMRRGGGENQDHYYNNVFDRFPRLYKPSKDTVVRAQDGFRCVINSEDI